MAEVLPAWELKEVETRLGEVARFACEQRPQPVMACGQDEVVVLSTADYARLAPATAKTSLFALFADSSFIGLEGFDEQLTHEKAPVHDGPDF